MNIGVRNGGCGNGGDRWSDVGKAGDREIGGSLS